MSDPVWKGEIEDVIASIRRLVTAAPEAQRLILTEALRIDREEEARKGDGETPAAKDDPVDETATQPYPAAANSARGPLRLDGSSVSAAPAASGNSALERALAELEADLAGAAQAMGTDRDDRGGNDLAASTAPDDPGDGSDDDGIPAAAGEIAIGDGEGGRDGDGEGDGYDPWEPSDAPVGSSRGETVDIVIDAAPVAEAEVLVFTRSGRAAAADGAAAETLTGELPADPAAESVSADAPGGEEAGPVAGDTPKGPAPDEENVAKPDIESLLDENDLRALVAEVLREELKGPLGERITRNVRKLVRREIALALSREDLG